MKKIKMWYARWFKVIEREQAIEWGLTYQRGVYGDEINHINCRSIWTDKLGRLYRVRSLYSITHNVLQLCPVGQLKEQISITEKT